MDAPAAPRFEQIGTSSVYETKVAGSVGWAGYLLSPEPGLPDAIAFEDSLADQNGHYLFCTERPAGIDEDPAGFATKALRYIAAATRNRAVVWLASADPVVFGDFSRYGLPFLYFGSVYQATADLNLPFGSNAAFHILNQTRLAIAGDALKFSASAINSPPFIAFQTNDGDPLGVRLAPTSNRIEAFVPFTGANSGCVTFDGALDPKAAFDNADLGLGFRYVLRDQDTQQLETIGYSALSAAELPSKPACAVHRAVRHGSEDQEAQGSGGEGGIRTHGTRKGTTVFETAPIDHSGTSPRGAAHWIVPRGTARRSTERGPLAQRFGPHKRCACAARRNH